MRYLAKNQNVLQEGEFEARNARDDARARHEHLTLLASQLKGKNVHKRDDNYLYKVLLLSLEALQMTLEEFMESYASGEVGKRFIRFDE